MSYYLSIKHKASLTHRNDCHSGLVLGQCLHVFFAKVMLLLEGERTGKGNSRFREKSEEDLIPVPEYEQSLHQYPNLEQKVLTRV